MDQAKLEAVESVLRIHVASLRAKVVSGIEMVPTAATLTYGEVAQRANISAQSVSVYLNAIAAKLQPGEPSLDCLVVSARTRRPSTPKWKGSDWLHTVERCYRPED